MTTRHPTCRGPLTRRTWLKLGGLSLGALATGIDPTLAHLLAAASAPNAQLSRDFSVILFWANGGPSHIDTFDLKPDAPAEIRGPFRPIRTNVPGMEFTELLPNLAKLGDKITILRNLHHNRGEHSGGTHRFLTGYSSRKSDLNDSENPDIGSIVADRLQSQATDVPLYVSNTKFYGSGPAYLGKACAPFMPSPNPLSSTGNNTYDPVPIYLTPQSQENLSLSVEGAVTLRRRFALAQTMDSLAHSLDQPATLASFGEFQRQAVEMLAGRRTREAFDLSRENARTRARYGDSHYGKSLLTCRRLIEAGARFVQCQADFRLHPATGRTSNWDDHSVNSHIFDAYKEKFPSFDQSVSALIEDLYQRGLDKHVLFIFAGEFGRTPRIAYQDTSRRPGRDHWPRAMSVLLAGGGLKMAQVVGATNPRGESPTHRAMDSNSLLATLYRRFGINPTHHFHDRTARPLALLPHGEPIPDLF